MLGLVLVVLAVGFFFLASSNLDRINENSTPLPARQEKTANQFDLAHNDTNYRINWALIPVPKNIVIGANLDDKKTAKSIYSENECIALINGGFYNENNDYIGLLYIEGKKLSNESSDAFFNGVFYITKSGEVGIGSGVPLEQIRHAVQSGPLLVRYRAYQKLKIANDEYKRRMIIAMNNKSEVLFLTIYDPVSGYLGSKLADVPEILEKFAKDKEIAIVDALNLDGGSASAFYVRRQDDEDKLAYTEGVALGEITHIGSYLCAR